MTTETTEQFMARFRATGLDMLCEARRREQQGLPFFLNWRGTRTGRISSSWPVEYTPNREGGFFRSVNGRYVDGDGPSRNAWKTAKFAEHYNTPWPDVLNLDFSDIERRVLVAHRPEGPPLRILTGVPDGIHPLPMRDYQRTFVSGRRVGQSYLRQATAAMLMSHAMNDLGDAFDAAHRSMSEWAAGVQSGLRRSARIYPHEVRQWEVPKPPGRSLGPDKEIEQPNEMRLNRKRIEKERRRKKLAKKSRK